ncbi:MAG: GNAT family N-acetyltransferase [Spirochaetaceae bacterium]|nr:GNAT family N-acetyltransferase [Spirochaetaceae bacterium]
MGGKIVPEKLTGKYVTLREVTIDDAEFILSLRCDEKKSRFLHKTDYNIEKQIEYINRYYEISDEWYFIILNKKTEQIGTYRIYDVQGDSFCIGSWILVDGVTPAESFESDYLLRMYGFDVLGFKKIHFNVCKGNKKVIAYHKMMGARIIDETEQDLLWEITRDEYLNKINIIKTAL